MHHIDLLRFDYTPRKGAEEGQFGLFDLVDCSFPFSLLYAAMKKRTEAIGMASPIKNSNQGGKRPGQKFKSLLVYTEKPTPIFICRRGDFVSVWPWTKKKPRQMSDGARLSC